MPNWATSRNYCMAYEALRRADAPWLGSCDERRMRFMGVNTKPPPPALQ
ncbi:hypothetical protein GGE12_002079 [Rhizobium mongolense]|uniref:Uncharacterized protein n=1 Tax=Rhizobium mongolense TaxID=57676 RepID=A0A7W6RKS6_9HYPH|nr:hypothetical protein [Rhizobium mongolense]